MQKDTEGLERIEVYNENRMRPILVQINKECTKSVMLKNAKHLKGSDIWVDNDYSRKMKEERKMLVTQMKEARQKGSIAYIRNNKLVVERKSKKNGRQ